MAGSGAASPAVPPHDHDARRRREGRAVEAMGPLIKKYGWVLAAVVAAVAVGYCGWLVYTDAPAYRLLVRLYVDKKFLKQTLRQLGVLAPIVFILLQALQVIISPIPGAATGFLGGYLFGEWLGLIYSTIGLTLGSVVAFWIGRWLGEHYVRNLVSKETWARLGFIVEAEGAILCFIIFVIPGLPKDMVCYLFGISPMPLWVFALVSGLGRIPGTWVLSSQGAHVESGDYRYTILISAICAAVALPLYYYRHRLVGRAHGGGAGAAPYAERLDRDKADP